MPAAASIYISTRGLSPAVDFSEALLRGVAPDGGLYVPEQMPAARNLQAGASLAETAATLLQPFFAILFAVPLLGEPLDATTLVFAVGVVATVILGRRLSRA